METQVHHFCWQANVEVLQRCMPVSIRTANYLSGGQSLEPALLNPCPEDAAARLNAINKQSGKKPWTMRNVMR
eukprot:2720170-Amphidinium_carterae.1